MPGEVFVVDASAVAALLFDEPSGRTVARLLEGGHLSAPAILPCELASVTLKKIALRPEQEPGLRAAAQLFERMGVDLVAVPIEAIVRIARRTGLSAYDSAYVWLASELGRGTGDVRPNPGKGRPAHGSQLPLMRHHPDQIRTRP